MPRRMRFHRRARFFRRRALSSALPLSALLAFCSGATARDEPGAQASNSAKTSPAAKALPAATTGATDTLAVPPARVPLEGTLSWILMDVESGRVLREHNAHRRVFPASTTKTMTALVAMSRDRLDRVVKIGPNPPKTGEQSAYLMQGERFALRDLLRAAMIKSANDACVAIAEAVAGDVPRFATAMNRKARQVGARDTNFVNPHGLHDARHYTTAYDLAMIARAAMKYRFFNQIVDAPEATIHGNYKIGATRLLVNKNRLLRRWNECDGVKTGYTKQAGKCLVASATRKVQGATGARPFRLISVVMHSLDTWGDSAWLLRQGFSNWAPVEIARANQEFGAVNVAGGAQSAQAVSRRAIHLPLRLDERAVLTEQKHFLPLRAPLKSGQNIGRVDYLSGDQVLVSAPLFSRQAVPVSLSARVMPVSAHFVPSAPFPRAALLGAVGLLLLLFLWMLRPRPKTRASTSTSTKRNPPPDPDTRKNHASTHTAPIASTVAQSQRQNPAAPRTSAQNPGHPAARRESRDDAAATQAAAGDISRANSTSKNASSDAS